MRIKEIASDKLFWRRQFFRSIRNHLQIMTGLLSLELDCQEQEPIQCKRLLNSCSMDPAIICAKFSKAETTNYGIGSLCLKVQQPTKTGRSSLKDLVVDLDRESIILYLIIMSKHYYFEIKIEDEFRYYTYHI